MTLSSISASRSGRNGQNEGGMKDNAMGMNNRFIVMKDSVMRMNNVWGRLALGVQFCCQSKIEEK